MMTTLGGSNYYFGLNDIASEGNWVWSDGYTSGYSNWKPGEPNNLQNSDCGYFHWPGYSGQWDDGVCGTSTPWFICSIH